MYQYIYVFVHLYGVEILLKTSFSDIAEVHDTLAIGSEYGTMALVTIEAAMVTRTFKGANPYMGPWVIPNYLYLTADRSECTNTSWALKGFPISLLWGLCMYRCAAAWFVGALVGS